MTGDVFSSIQFHLSNPVTHNTLSEETMHWHKGMDFIT